MELILGGIAVVILLYAAIRFLFWSIKTTLKMMAIGIAFLCLTLAGLVIWWVWF
jgi:hypothetical protein